MSVDENAKEGVQECKIYWTTKFRCWEGDGQLASLNNVKYMFCPVFMMKCSWSGISRARPNQDSLVARKKIENVVNLVFELANNLDNNYDLRKTIAVLSTATRNSKAKSQRGKQIMPPPIHQNVNSSKVFWLSDYLFLRHF